MERSLAFYVGQLGFVEVARHTLDEEPISTMVGRPHVNLRVVRLACPGTPDVQIDLQQYVAPVGKVADGQLGDIRHSHIAVTVEDLAAVHRTLSEDGVRFVSAPVTFDLGREGTAKVVFLEDPDGSILELVEAPRSA
jgi:catechol 2,3-dioxygenase-like lactoylglutathione lyase family enzyme